LLTTILASFAREERGATVLMTAYPFLLKVSFVPEDKIPANETLTSEADCTWLSSPATMSSTKFVDVPTRPIVGNTDTITGCTETYESLAVALEIAKMTVSLLPAERPVSAGAVNTKQASVLATPHEDDWVTVAVVLANPAKVAGALAVKVAVVSAARAAAEKPVPTTVTETPPAALTACGYTDLTICEPVTYVKAPGSDAVTVDPVLTVTEALPAAVVVGTDTRNTTMPVTASYVKTLILAAATDWVLIVTAKSEAWGGAVMPEPKFFVTTSTVPGLLAFTMDGETSRIAALERLPYSNVVLRTLP